MTRTKKKISQVERERIAEVRQAFEGKTIKRVNATAVNQWEFTFTDGTVQAVHVEAVFPSIGLHGLALVDT